MTTYSNEFLKIEISELRRSLSSSMHNHDLTQLKHAVFKVISTMTLGINLADLYPDMIMVSHVRDIVIKKMVYLYLIRYARDNEDLALLAINTFTNDCDDDSPLIRGLALRNFSALRTPSLFDHMIEPLKKGLVDRIPYVRRVAVVGCCKLYQLAPEVICEDVVLRRLRDLVKDDDAVVSVNAVNALTEIRGEDGGLVVDKGLAVHLLSRLGGYSEWGQNVILNVLIKYVPEEEDVLHILKILDARLLNTRSASMVLGVARLMMLYTESHPKLYNKVFGRLYRIGFVYLFILDPLNNCLVSASHETKFNIYCHILMLIKKVPELYQQNFRSFYILYSDPTYLKIVKLKLLVEVVTERNAPDIISELSAYVFDFKDNEQVVRSSIDSIAKVAMKIPPTSEQALLNILAFLEVEQIPYVLNTTISALKDLLRCFPKAGDDILLRLIRIAREIDDEKALASIVWMFGQFGMKIKESPYILEEVIDDWEGLTNEVKLPLITATIKTFFARPLEVKPILSKLFNQALFDYDNPDVHGRAQYYYRLLKQPEEAKEVINGYTSEYSETDHDTSYLDLLFEQFNTLSVVYEKPEEYFKADLDEEDEYYEDLDESISEEEDQYADTYNNSNYQNNEPIADMNPKLTMDEQATLISSVSLDLISDAQLSSGNFEALWGKLDIGYDTNLTNNSIQFQSVYEGSSIDAETIKSHLKTHSIFTVAQGKFKDILKIYLYAQEATTGGFILIELLIDTKKMVYGAKIKSPMQDVVSEFKVQFDAILNRL